MNRHYYRLNETGNPVAEADPIKWAESFETTRLVAYETIGSSIVSTVFLGIDHGVDLGSDLDNPPVLWETMVFGGKLDQEQDRCSGNREQAEAMHARMVERVRTP